MLFLKRERRLNKAAAGHPFYEDFVPLCLINSPSIFHSRELRTHLYSKDDLSTILSEAKKRSWVTKISPAPPITQKIIYAYQIFSTTFFMPKKCCLFEFCTWNFELLGRVKNSWLSCLRGRIPKKTKTTSSHEALRNDPSHLSSIERNDEIVSHPPLTCRILNS